ncbi:MAG: MFS transporter [Verrucomicrobiota bacterium]
MESGKTRLKQTRFSVMMLLQFFTRGAWFVTLGIYLGETLSQDGKYIGFAYSLFGIAAIITPFFVGMVADRYFATQRVMGLLHLCAGLIMVALAQVTDPALFTWVLFAYCIVYTPTEALANSIVFTHMPRRSFPYVRMFGTIGWVFAGLFLNFVLGRWFGFEGVEQSILPFYVAAGSSLLLGIYSFSLPNTPPPRKGEKTSIGEVVGADAFRLFRSKSFCVFMIASLLVMIPMQMYFSFFGKFLTGIGVEEVASKMTLGQVSEALFMLAIPVLVLRVGMKWMMALGLALWAIRYFLFAEITIDRNTLIIFTILIHGACYDFFNVTGSMYVDSKAGEKFRAAAQGLYVLVFIGLGKFVGSNVAGLVVDQHDLGAVEGATTFDWPAIFQTTGWISVGIFVFFVLFFHDKEKKEADGATEAG